MAVAALDLLYITHHATEYFLEHAVVTPFQGILDMPKAKYFFCLCLNYLLAILYRQLPNNVVIKHIFNLAVGLWMCALIDPWSIVHAFASSTFIYILMAVAPTKHARWLGIAVAFLHCTTGHIYRMVTDFMGFTLNWALIQMLLTQKLVMYCFDIHDGTLPVKEVHHPHAVHHRLTTRPNLLEYYGYIFFFPTIMVGPMHPFKKYQEFVDMSLFQPLGGKIPEQAYWEGLKRFGASIVWIPVYIVGLYFPLLYCLTPEFAAQPIVYRILYQVITSYWFKPLYYFAWLATEGALIMMGYGIEPQGRGVVRYDRGSNVSVREFELSSSIEVVASKWNVATARWLKYYFYTRMLSANLKAWANPVTYTISAFWHGFYPGYYLLFIMGPVLTQVAFLARRKIQPYFLEEDGATEKPTFWIWNWLCIFSTAYVTTYCLGSFTTLNFWDSVYMFNVVWWNGHILTALWILIMVLLPSPRRAKGKERDTRRSSTEDGNHVDSKFD